MILIFLTFLTALLMEGIGSYMSVIGWNSILVGDWIIISLFVVLDLAKIISVSFLYQTWGEIKQAWRAYLIFAVTFLMILTSAGSFGYLSSSFQKAIAPNKEISLQIQSAQTERDKLEIEKNQLITSKTKIEDQIAKLPDNFVSGRTRLIQNFKEETRGINDKISKIDSRLEELNKTILNQSTTQLQKDTHIGPIVYFSNAFNIPIEKVVSIAILSIIFVFDPLAISLILAGNFLIMRKKNNKINFINPMAKIVNDNQEEFKLKSDPKSQIEIKTISDDKVISNEFPLTSNLSKIKDKPNEIPTESFEQTANTISNIIEKTKEDNIEKKNKKNQIGNLDIGPGKKIPVLQFVKEDSNLVTVDDMGTWNPKSSFSHLYSSNN